MSPGEGEGRGRPAGGGAPRPARGRGFAPARAPGRALVAIALAALGLFVPAAGAVDRLEPGHRAHVLSRASASARALESAASATWCGTPSTLDARPNVVAGYPVHWVYVVPSDGQDRFATLASVMQTDAEEIDAWWRGQDPTRAPRQDLAQFSCGQQLDLSVVRLPQTSADLAAGETPFDAVWSALAARGFSSPATRYLVYFDGPIGSSEICGAGAALSGGPGIAMVFVQSCPGIPSAEIAAHELLHTLGAVPQGAPHACPAPDDGHTCDDVRDLMYPSTDGSPLSEFLLDPGRDDYYGHAGSWADAQDSRWLVQLDRQARLATRISGRGSVAADVPGLECAQSCTTTWNAGTALVLTAAPDAGSKLVRWGGACTGAGRCALTVDQGSAVSALFAPATYRVRVRLTGRGAVRSASRAIACPGRCAAAVPSYTPLRLTATAAKGWRLVRWSGACRGARPTCTVPMTSSTSARAVFVRR